MHTEHRSLQSTTQLKPEQKQDKDIAVFARDSYRNTGIETFEANVIPHLLTYDNVNGIDFQPSDSYPFSITLQKLTAGYRLKKKIQGHDSVFVFSQDRVVFDPDSVEADVIPYVHDIIPVTAMYKTYSNQSVVDRLRGYLSTVMGVRYMKFIANCSHVIASSHVTARELKQRTAYTGDITVVYQGVDDKPEKPLNDAEDRDIDLLYVGSMIERKNPETIKKSIKAAQDAGYSTAAVNFENIDVPGPVYTDLSDTELVNLYNRSRFYLHPSRHEGFGRCPVEAQRYGATPLALSIPINHEILGENGRHWYSISRARPVDDIIQHLDATPIYPARVKENSTRFTWSDTRRQILEVLQ